MADTMLLSSAVRMPTPPPGGSYSPGPSNARKRSPPSRSPSPKRRRPALAENDVRDRRTNGGQAEREMDDRERELLARFKPEQEDSARRKPLTAEEKQAAAKAEYEKLLTMRSGGTYIPPARLRELQSQITDKTSKEYQRMAWEALKKSINGLINKINVSNIKHIVPELFGENLVRGRGLFCRSIMKAQAASLPFTPIYAAMAAIVNTKLPQVGELLLNRLVVQFRKAFKRNDKAVCLSSTTFIAHLCNQQVAHETVAAQLLLLLLHKPTDDSVEIAVGLTREVGQHLEEMSPPIALAVFDQFRSILHEADIDKRVQYMIEVLFQVRKDRYKDNPAIKEELDLVEEEDQITHQIDLDDDINVQDTLNIFKFDPEWEENEEAYRKLKAEILGEDSGDEEGDESGSEESSDDEEQEQERAMEIKDQTNTDLVNLRRTIYLTIMSSLDFEEACHKLMKVQLPPGQEPELPSMIVECCSQEKTYSKFFGLVGERFAKLNRLWTDLFEQSFAKYYDTIHRYETNRLRNIARFFGHLLATDAIGWHVFSVIHLNEDETTSSSRIFIKILFQDLAEAMGIPKLQERMKDDILRGSFVGLFPTDTPRNTRFSINYFTSIGMGALTEELREHLKNLPKPAPPPLPVPKGDASDSESVSSYSSYSSYSSSRSYSRSASPPRGDRFRRDASPPAKSKGRPARRDDSMSRSRSPPTRGPVRRGRSPTRSMSRSISHSPPRRAAPARRRSPSYSASRSPPPRNNRVTAPPRGRARTRSESYSSYSSRSRSPPRRQASKRHAKDTRIRSPSRSPAPPPRRAPSPAVHPSRRQLVPQSPSPPRYNRRAPPNTRNGGRRSPSRSMSRSVSPAPRRNGRNDRYDPPPRRAARDRSYTRSLSRSPSPPRQRGPPAQTRRRRNSSSVDSRSRSQTRSLSRTPPRRSTTVKNEDRSPAGKRVLKKEPVSPAAGRGRAKAGDFD
jgi:pre-mRNA-splicing factor CWC22